MPRLIPDVGDDVRFGVGVGKVYSVQFHRRKPTIVPVDNPNESSIDVGGNYVDVLFNDGCRDFIPLRALLWDGGKNQWTTDGWTVKFIHICG